MNRSELGMFSELSIYMIYLLAILSKIEWVFKKQPFYYIPKVIDVKVEWRKIKKKLKKFKHRCYTLNPKCYKKIIKKKALLEQNI